MLCIKSYKDVKVVGAEVISHRVIRVEFKYNGRSYTLKNVSKQLYGEYVLYEGIVELNRAVVGWDIEFGYLFNPNGVDDIALKNFVWALSMMRLAQTEFSNETDNLQERLGIVVRDLQVINNVFQNYYKTR